MANNKSGVRDVEVDLSIPEHASTSAVSTTPTSVVPTLSDHLLQEPQLPDLEILVCELRLGQLCLFAYRGHPDLPIVLYVPFGESQSAMTPNARNSVFCISIASSAVFRAASRIAFGVSCKWDFCSGTTNIERQRRIIGRFIQTEGLTPSALSDLCSMGRPWQSHPGI